MTICVYCSSSDRVDRSYFELAEVFGRELGKQGHGLVYGGGSVGLMGATARAVHAAGGHVCGVIPEALKVREGVAYDSADELVVTGTMRERKRIMIERADAFVALPGGHGTLEEFMEVLTLRQLGYHRKPVVLLNADGFYDLLLRFFEQLYERRFARERSGASFYLAQTPKEALDHVAAGRGVPRTS